MNHGSLFSGIGGFDLAAEWVGWTNVFQVDNDKWCQKILQKNFPNTDKYEDIKEFDGTKYRGTVDIISGGFPCQPFSHAGKRKGEADDRFLWFEMLRIIREVQPQWVVGENVAGLLSMDGGKTLETILTSLEDEGYNNEIFVIPACGVGAWHKRERVWIVSNTDLSGSGTPTSRDNRKPKTENQRRKEQPQSEFSGHSKNVADPTGIRPYNKKKQAFRGRKRVR